MMWTAPSEKDMAARCWKSAYRQKCSALFEHIYESYPERDAGVYAVAG